MKRFLAIGTAALSLLLVSRSSKNALPDTGRPASGAAPVDAASTFPGHFPGKKIYPWSVVTGGIDSPLVMKAAMIEDGVVRDHYAGLEPKRFRAERLSEPRKGYVSYRIRDRVYWTRKPATLQAGELILTDGKSMLRGRCGNQVSSIPREPVAPPAIEPPETALDTPVEIAQLAFSPVPPGLPKGVPPASDVVATPPATETKAVTPGPGGAQPDAPQTGVVAPPARPPEQVLYTGVRTPVQPPVLPPSVIEPGGGNIIIPGPFLPPPGGPGGPIVIAGLQPPSSVVILPPTPVSPDFPGLPPGPVLPPSGPWNPPVVNPPGGDNPPGKPTDPPPGPSDPPPPTTTNPPDRPTSEPPIPEPPTPETSIPEPATGLLLLAGAAAFLAQRLRKR